MATGVSGRDPFKILRRTRSIIQAQGWKGLGKSAIGTLLLAVLFGGIDVLNAVLNVPITLLNSLGLSLSALNEGLFVGLANFIGSFLGAAGGSFGSGWTALLGPFQGPLGVAVLIIMLWEIAWYLDYVDSDFIGVVVNIPDFLLSSSDSGVADEEQ